MSHTEVHFFAYGYPVGTAPFAGKLSCMHEIAFAPLLTMGGMRVGLFTDSLFIISAFAYTRYQQTISIKGQIVCILDFEGITFLFHCSKITSWGHCLPYWKLQV